MTKFLRLKWLLILTLILLFYPFGYFVLEDSNLPIPNNDIEGGDLGVYLINLNRSKERYNYIKGYLIDLELPFERIEALDGSSLSKEEIESKVDFKFFNPTQKLGTVGCSLSHIKVWETFLRSNFKFALIFEDDVSFDPNKLKVVIKDLIKNSQLWDLVSFEIFHRGFPLTIKKLENGNNLVLYLTKVTHSGAYMINRKAAKNLLKKALPIKMPIDHYFTRSWELDIKFTGIENPRLVNQTFGESDIEKTKQISKDNKNVFSLLYLEKIQSELIRFFYNLKLYLQS
jgi:glycosyl transferase family 25